MRLRFRTKNQASLREKIKRYQQDQEHLAIVQGIEADLRRSVNRVPRSKPTASQGRPVRSRWIGSEQEMFQAGQSDRLPARERFRVRDANGMSPEA
ncbi:hypothetical protein SAMN05444166_7204 [Singulisphaera sp. GP187]|nr:hypothetical protein SAMN05444166_7204 [Singulisphaera sp. GP187]